MDKLQLNIKSHAEYKMIFSHKKKIEDLFRVKIIQDNVDSVTPVASSKTSKGTKSACESSSRSRFSSPENDIHSRGGNFPILFICGDAKNQKQAKAYILALVRPEIVHIFAYQKELQIIFGTRLWIECLELTYGVCISDDSTDYVLTVSGTESSVTSAVMCMQGLSEQYEASKNNCITNDNRLQRLDTQLVNAARSYKQTELPIHRYSLLPFAVKDVLLSWLCKAFQLKEETISCIDSSCNIRGVISKHSENMEISGTDLSVIVIESDPEDEQEAHDQSILILEPPQKPHLHAKSCLNSDCQRDLCAPLAKNIAQVSSYNTTNISSSHGTQNSNMFSKQTNLLTSQSPDIEIVDVVRRGSSVQPSKEICRQQILSSDNQHHTSQHTSHLSDASMCPPNQWITVHSHAPSRPNRQLRPVVIDGSNVAMSHGKPERVFSCRGIALCVEYFIKRGHTNVTAFVPQYRRSNCYDIPVTDQHLLEELALKQLVVFTPSRRLGNKRISSYDDRFIVELAFKNNGVIVSNDNFRDVMAENEGWKRTVENRLLMYCFVGDIFMVPVDPLGRYGPHLDEFLALPC